MKTNQILSYAEFLKRENLTDTLNNLSTDRKDNILIYLNYIVTQMNATVEYVEYVAQFVDENCVLKEIEKETI